MKNIVHLGIVLSIGMLAAPAFAGPIVDPTATIASTDVGGGVFDYKITLTNSSSSPAPIGTFWYSWVPGKDFLDTAPLSLTSPTGWTGLVTNTGPTDGFAIQWVANPADVLAPGSSQTFEFKSTETPQQLMGNSSFFPTSPQATSFVYSGAPFSDAGTELTVVPASTPPAVPEPSSLALTIAGGLLLIVRKRIGRRKQA